MFRPKKIVYRHMTITKVEYLLDLLMCEQCKEHFVFDKLG